MEKPKETTLETSGFGTEGNKDDSEVRCNNVQFNYGELKNEYIGSGSRKLQHFDGTFYDHWKHRMELYLGSMGRPILKIVKHGFELEDEENPTTNDEIKLNHNDQAASAIVSALSS